MYPTPAIVIGRINLGEADRILTLLTPDYGKLRVSIRGVRKIKSRLAGHVELFSQTRLMLAKGKSLDVVTSAEMEHSVDGILGRPERLNLAYLMATMFDRLSLEGEAQPELYALAKEFLATLDGSGQTDLLELGLKLRVLATLGYRPELGHCVICHKSDAASTYYLSPERGGLVDETCGVAGGYRFDQRAIKLWRLALTLPLNRLDEIEGANQLARDSLDLVDQFYDYHFGRRFSGGLLEVLEVAEPTSELLWKLADYQRAGIEPPDQLRDNPQLCEGEMMLQDEVDDFIRDSIATLRILADKASPRWEEVAATYRLDLAALLELGRIDQDEYNELTDVQNLHF